MRKVLVVDDEKAFKEMMRRMLERYSLDVRTAEDGEKGFELVSKEKFDLIIADYLMPKMNGLEFFEQCHQQFPNLPLIMISGHLPDDWNGPGHISFLKKPFPLYKLDILVKEALKDE